MNEVVTAAWEKVLERWDDPARHDALRALVVQYTCFTWAVSKYKERGDAVAEAQLTKLRNAAMASMFAASAARKVKEESSPYKRALVWIAVFMVMLVFGLLAAKLMVTAHHAGRP